MDEDIWSKVLGNVNGGGCGEVVCPSAVSIVKENITGNEQFVEALLWIIYI